jgi:hypothetical protein
MKELLIDLFQSIGLMEVDAKNYVITDSPEKEGDKVLGDMTDLEKTCYLFLLQKNLEHEELHRQLDHTQEGSDESAKLEHQHYLLKKAINVVDRIMLTSIAYRFEDQKDAAGFAFRNGNKVVAIFEKQKRSYSMPFVLISIPG